MIRSAARRWGLSEAYMIKIATCESTLGLNLINPNYTAEDGSHPTGVYQFTLGTWTDLAPNIGYKKIDERLNNYKNIELTMWAFKHGQSWRWECK